jgi:hypothetical protein
MRPHFLVSAACLVLSLLSGCKEPEGKQIPSISKDEGRQSNDIGIATIPTPMGWLPNRSGGNTAIIFLREQADQKNPDEMISIDVGTPSFKEVKESADGLAKKFGGAVSDLPFKIDGEVAYQVSIPPNYEQVMPRECVVVHHNDKVCFIFGASKSQSDIRPTILEIAKSMEWN